MRSWFFLGLTFLLPPLSGQDQLYEQLADEVCRCLEASGDPLEVAAPACLEIVANRQRTEIAETFNLSASSSVHRVVLADGLASFLLANCPLLSTLPLNTDDPELSWSDAKAATVAPESWRYVSPKSPPANPADRVVGEVPLRWRASGQLLAKPGGNALRLRTDDGQELRFEYAAALNRQHRLAATDRVRVTYRREWRKASGTLVLVVTDAVRLSGLR